MEFLEETELSDKMRIIRGLMDSLEECQQAGCRFFAFGDAVMIQDSNGKKVKIINFNEEGKVRK